MDRFSRALYILLMTAALSLGVTAYGAGNLWPELQKQVGAAINSKWQPENATYLLSREEADTLDLCRVLSRVERGGWLLGFVCLGAAFVVALRGQLKVGPA